MDGYLKVENIETWRERAVKGRQVVGVLEIVMRGRTFLITAN